MKKIMLFFLATFCLPCLAMEDGQWDAELYDEHAKYQYEASLEYLKKFDLGDSEFDTVVELGCNTGNVAAAIAKKYPDKTVVGIEPEKACIEFGRKKHVSRNLQFIRDNAQRYNLRSHNIPLANLVVCYHVAHWIPRDELPTAFCNIAHNLAPNGKLDIVTSAKQKSTLTKAVLRTILSIKWCWYLPWCIKQVWNADDNKLTLLEKSELSDLATSNGLIVDRCEEVETIANFESQKQFYSWVKCILQPHGIKNIVGDRQDEFVQEVCDLYHKDYNTATDGTIKHHIKELHLTAHKRAE